MRRVGICLLVSGILLIGVRAGQSRVVVLESSASVFDVAPWTQAVSIPTDSGQRFYLLSRHLSTLAVYDHPNHPAHFRRLLAHRPTALAIGPHGRIYLAEMATSRIRVLSLTGQPERTIPVAHHHPVSLAVLDSGHLVVAAPRRNGTLLHLFDPAGREVMGFGAVERFDVGNEAENLFLNRGLVLVDGSGRIYYVFQYAPRPMVQVFTRRGRLVRAFPVRGTAIALQVAAARRFLREKDPELVGGMTVITTAAIDAETGHLWLGMNGSSETGVIYEYTVEGEKVGEYALVVRDKARLRIITGVEALLVRRPFLYVFTAGGAYRFDLRQGQAGPLAVDGGESERQ